MNTVKRYIFNNFEQITVLCILLAVVALNYWIAEKLPLLNLFYLPSIVAAFVLGMRKAMLVSIFSVAAVLFYIVLDYNRFISSGLELTFSINIIAWASCLILASIVVGKLHEQNQKNIAQLKKAYTGILEILSKYIESADKYTQGHSVRVAHYATEIAAAMRLREREIENIKVAALLHDIGKVEISTDLIGKAASLSRDEKNIMDTHTERGAQILSSVGSVLSEAIPLVRAHHKYFDHEGQQGSTHDDVPLGARILAVADSYDAMTTDRPYRSGMPPWKAIEELERCTGTQFDPQVVESFKSILFHDAGTHRMLSGQEAAVEPA